MSTDGMESHVSVNSATVYISVIISVLTVCLFIKSMLYSETWWRYGVKHVSQRRILFQDFGQALNQLVKEEGDTVGFSFGGLQLLTRDLTLLKHVLVKDFNNFADRTVYIATNSPLEKGIFFLGGNDWRRIRHVISPSFSSGKLKRMTGYIDECSVRLTKLLETYVRDDQLVPIKHVMCQFTSEIIARTAFSLRTDCLDTGGDEFFSYCKEIFKIRGTLMNMLMVLMFQFPWLHMFLVKKLNIYTFDQVNGDANKYLLSILNNTIKDRKLTGRNRKKQLTDLLQNLLNAQENGQKERFNTADEIISESPDSETNTMTQDELLGQSMLIIFAGFETTASTLQICCYFLAKYPDIDAKVYEEIQKVVSSDTPTYDEISQLKYMEQVINETLRLFPPAPIITRRAAETRTYGDVTIPKGAGVIIPLDMIMRDPKHYPDPDRFDPERFTEENIAKRDPMTFVPFGYGPRQCIGMRLAYMELKYCLVHVLRKVKFELNQRTEPKPNGDIKTSFQGFIVLEKPIMLQVRARNS